MRDGDLMMKGTGRKGKGCGRSGQKSDGWVDGEVEGKGKR